jgi:hypothetical protein
MSARGKEKASKEAAVSGASFANSRQETTSELVIREHQIHPTKHDTSLKRS